MAIRPVLSDRVTYYRGCKKTISKTNSEYCAEEFAIKHPPG